MVARLTDFDHAVLAAAWIGVLKRQGPVWYLNGINVSFSLYRLEQAGELYVADRGDILMPGTEAWEAQEKRMEFRSIIRRGIRDGTIKFSKVPSRKSKLKGTKP